MKRIILFTILILSGFLAKAQLSDINGLYLKAYRGFVLNGDTVKVYYTITPNDTIVSKSYVDDLISTITSGVKDSNFVSITINNKLLSDVKTTTLGGVENYIIASKAYVDESITAGGGYTDKDAQDAVGSIVDDGISGDIVFTYIDTTPTLYGNIKSNILNKINSAYGWGDHSGLYLTFGGSNNQIWKSDGEGGGSWFTPSWVSDYPSIGVPISTGSSWSTSIALDRFIYGSDVSGSVDYTGNLNDINKSGFYFATPTSTNRPSGESEGYLIINQWKNPVYQAQLFIPYNKDILYIRRKHYQGYWENWAELGGGGGDMYKSVYDANGDGIIDVTSGGTGLSTYNKGSILYANSTTTLAELNAGTSGLVLMSNGVNEIPSWQALPGDQSPSLWTTSTNGIYYSSGNVGIGIQPLSSVGLSVNRSLSSGWAADINNSSSSGHGVRININNSTSSYAALSIKNQTHNILTARGDGNINFNKYGSGIFTGTATKWLAVTSTGEVIETDEPTGGSDINMSVQSLNIVGGNTIWDMNDGINGKITLSSNTTIAVSNVPVGYSGNLTVTNTSTARQLAFSMSGKTIRVSPFLNSTLKVITMSGSNKTDVLSWYYDGTNLFINGTKSYD